MQRNSGKFMFSLEYIIIMHLDTHCLCMCKFYALIMRARQRQTVRRRFRESLKIFFSWPTEKRRKIRLFFFYIFFELSLIYTSERILDKFEFNFIAFDIARHGTVAR